MHITFVLTIIVTSIPKPVPAVDVCKNTICSCSSDLTSVHCDAKEWNNLDGFDFPPSVTTLSLVGNHLHFETATDQAKINDLPKLTDLSINGNPLGSIPPFNNTKVQFLSLQDTSLTSAKFPVSYINALLQRISLSDNKIRSIGADDFSALRNSKLNRIRIDSSSVSTIDPNTFRALPHLQGLSLANNQLKSAEFLSNVPVLSSINLDQNQFDTLPTQLSTPGKIQTYSFKHNLITIIDESSPLSSWSKLNYTKMKIYLVNNSFDCCASLWFIQFLNRSSRFVGDASLLRCATPPALAGKPLLELNPDTMNCGGDIPGQSWWTTARILGIIIGSVSITIFVVVIVFLFIRFRHSSIRSDYQYIDDPYNDIDTASTSGPVFPTLDEDDDRLSHNVNITDDRSEATTQLTREGVYPVDGSQAGGSEIHDAVAIPPSFFSNPIH